MKKKIFVFIVALIIVLSLIAGVLYFKPVSIDIGESNIYSEQEIQSAIDIVKTKFDDFDGCKLFSLSYAGDENSKKEYDYDENYDQAIVINSTFLSPLFNSGAWNPHEIYKWHFILMRADSGEWQLLTYGYC